MRFLLQFGYGMMSLSEELLGQWGGGGVILSPRDLNPKQLTTFAKGIRSKANELYLDPQFYLPNEEHQRLKEHDYWPGAYASGHFWSGPDLDLLLRKLIQLNLQLGTDALFLPGLYTSVVDDDWLERINLVQAVSAKLAPQFPSYVTLALSSHALRTPTSIHAILDETSGWSARGVYLVLEHPENSYLVDDVAWLSNALDLIAGLRLKGLDVILGYSNQQMLLASAAGCRAIASGTWMNVRAFPPGKFEEPTDQIKRKKTWYYAPSTLSEFGLPYLDLAHGRGLLNHFAPVHCGCGPVTGMLAGKLQPTAVGLPERASFQHYLTELRGQWLSIRQPSFPATLDALRSSLQQARLDTSALSKFGISGEQRDYGPVVAPSENALKFLESTRGPILMRKWAGL